MSTAIIGAGIAGLQCAAVLAAADRSVVLFEASSGPGGRCGSHSTPFGAFDLGTQPFRATSPAFQGQVQRWRNRSAVGRYHGRVGTIDAGVWRPQADGGPDLYSALPRSSLLGRLLAQGHELRTQRRIVAVERAGNGLRLRSEGGDEGVFERVVVAVPTPQAGALVGLSPALTRAVGRVVFEPVWAAWLRTPGPVVATLDAAEVRGGPLGFVRRRSAAPDRPSDGGWVAQATPEWSAQHLDAGEATVAEALGRALTAVLPDRPAFTDRGAHLWRHGRVRQAIGSKFVADDALGLSLCGDGCLGARLEHAWLSGRALGHHLLEG